MYVYQPVVLAMHYYTTIILGTICFFSFYHWGSYSAISCCSSWRQFLYTNSQVISSGYILRDCSEDKSCDQSHDQAYQSCEVTYIHQVGSSVMPFVVEEFLGTSDLIQKLFSSLCNFIVQKQ